MVQGVSLVDIVL